MTLPKGKGVTLVTRPGVFAHRRVDEGAQALAEVALTKPGDRILDMGCGCGSIGISLAANQAGTTAVFVDSHTRAVQCTESNCKANGLVQYRVDLSDKGLEEDNAFTLVVGNPPYYSKNRIADLFVQTAYRCLKSGGRAYLVAKNATHISEVMQETFGNVESLHRRNYQIARAVKP